MNEAEAPVWLARFPVLCATRDAVWLETARRMSLVTLPAGARVFRPGDPCRHFLMLLEGAVRVQVVSEGGREIVLYRIGPGETCILTTACLFAGEPYPAEGVTETDVRAAALPLALFHETLAGSDGFRRFVFASFGERVAALLLLVQEVAFGRMDVRLAQRLLRLGGADGALAATHQQLAAELGSAREVVSRLLKEFERHGWVRLSRGQIELLDREGLNRLAQTPV